MFKKNDWKRRVADITMWKLRYQAVASPQDRSKQVASLAKNPTDTHREITQEMDLLHCGDGDCDYRRYAAGGILFRNEYGQRFVYFTHIPMGSVRRSHRILSRGEKVEDIHLEQSCFGKKSPWGVLKEVYNASRRLFIISILPEQTKP
jgi:hypothetical protein